MDNIDFLKKVLMSESEYWIVSKRNDCIDRRIDDQILFICISRDYVRGLKYEEILLKDIEDLKCLTISNNIFLSVEYAPFQQYQTMYGVYKGYPIKNHSHKVLAECMNIKSTDINDYKVIIDKYNNPSEPN